MGERGEPEFGLPGLRPGGCLDAPPTQASHYLDANFHHCLYGAVSGVTGGEMGQERDAYRGCAGVPVGSFAHMNCRRLAVTMATVVALGLAGSAGAGAVTPAVSGGHDPD